MGWGNVGEDLPADAGFVEQICDAGGGAVFGQDRDVVGSTHTNLRCLAVSVMT